jgi:cell wall-associated NlpC family hydrolase
MPIHRLTAVSVLAAALLAAMPAAQATTGKTHAKTAHAQHKQAHGKPVAHHKPVHGKLAKAAHGSTHARSAASGNPIAAIDTPVIANTIAPVETKSALLGAGSLQSHAFAMTGAAVAANPAKTAPTWLSQAPAFDQPRMLLQSTATTYYGAQVAGRRSVETSKVALGDRTPADDQAADTSASDDVTDVRKALISLAMKLRDIRYVRGGNDPSTGFDCSGFVRYVFAHATGIQLPANSASQFLGGLKVKRADMKPGDLVFFHTHGKRGISHVGIYISDGRFIHSPTVGKSVEISSLDDAYWAKRFAGAKRPEAIAQVAHNG